MTKTIKIQFSKNLKKNEETYEGKGDVLCLVCGKPTKGKAAYIHMNTNLEAVNEEDEQKVENSQGFFMVGSECIKQFPKDFIF